MAYRRIDDNDTVEIRRAQGGNKPETRTVAELNEYFSKEEPPITAGAPIAPVAAQAVLTLSGTLTDGDVVTVNDITYTFKTTLSDPAEPNEVLIGENEDASVTNLAAAINGDGTEGTNYSTGTEQPTDVTAVASIANDTVTCTAKTAGVAGNAYPKAATGDKLDWDGEGKTFTLGTNGTVGAAGALRYSDTELYVSVGESTTAVSNWKSITLNN